MAGQYAKTTEVTAERSRAEIEKTLVRYGATGFITGWAGNRALVEFIASGRRVRFTIPMPDPEDPDFTMTPSGTQKRAKAEAKKHYDTAVRRVWRVFLLLIKAKLDAVESGVETFDEAFFAHLVLPNGATVGETVGPGVVEAYATGEVKPLLPDYRRAITAGGN